VLIALHATAATLAVALGAVVIRHRPRGDRTHRTLGRVWFGAMYFTVLSSFGIKRLTPGHFSWIHGLSLFTFATLTLALYGARTHNVGLHRGNVIGSYCGLVGAGIAAAAFPVRAVPQLAMHRPLVLAGALLLIVLAVALLTAFVTRRGDGVTPRRFARYVQWGSTRGALSYAYDDDESRRGLSRDVGVVPDRRRSGRGVPDADADEPVRRDDRVGAAAG
jgi:uncharacterized membrane protein